MSYSKAYPTLCYSIKPYKKSNKSKYGGTEQKRLKRSKDVNRFGKILSKRFGKGLAYGHMLCSIRFDNDYSDKTNNRYESFLRGRGSDGEDDGTSTLSRIRKNLFKSILDEGNENFLPSSIQIATIDIGNGF